VRHVVARVVRGRAVDVGFGAAAVRPDRDALGELLRQTPVRVESARDTSGRVIRRDSLGEIDEAAAARVPPARARDVTAPTQKTLDAVPSLF